MNSKFFNKTRFREVLVALFFIFTGLSLLSFTNGSNGNDLSTIKIIPLNDIRHLEILTDAEIILTDNRTPRMILLASKSILQSVDGVRKGDRMSVCSKRRPTSRDLKVYIPAAALQYLFITGNSVLRTEEKLDAQNLQIVHRGVTSTDTRRTANLRLKTSE